MQRIDEDVYIDDTLVTCAEYQLFIDEMRDQGRDFLPDHWTSDRFSRGQAHAPILGVRSSDAQTFCEWLSKRDAGEWHYRLPTVAEAEYPLRLHSQEPIGYWTIGKNLKTQITWIGIVHPDAERLVRTVVEELEQATSTARFLEDTLTNTILDDSKFDLANTLIFELDSSLDNAIESIRILKFNMDLVNNLALVKKISNALAHDHTSIRAKESAHQLVNTLSTAIAVHLPILGGIRLVKERIR